MALRVVTAPSGLPVKLDYVKAQLRIDHGDEDDKLEGLILTATTRLEAATQRRFVEQTLEWTPSLWPHGWPSVLCAPVAPVAEVTSFQYVDAAGVTQTLSPSNYVTFQAGGGDATMIRCAPWLTWPCVSLAAAAPVKITLKVGVGVEAIEPNVKQAIILMMRELYDGEDQGPRAASGLSRPVEDLVAQERWS